MSEEISGAYSIERRDVLGTDLYTEISKLDGTRLRDSKNLTVEGGLIKTRPGSILYGSVIFNPAYGTRHCLFFVTTQSGEYALAHINNKIYYCDKNGGSFGIVQDLTGAADLIVANAPHPSREAFVPLGAEFNGSAGVITKVLFRNAAGCKILEFYAFGWRGRDPSVSSGTSYFSLATAAISNQELGKYRVRVLPARAVGGYKVAEGAAFGRGATLTNKPYQEIEIVTAGDSIRVTITHGGLGLDLTHWVIEVTRPLVFASGTDFTVNGNDPTIFYEAAFVAKSGGATTVVDLNLNALSLVKQDTRNFLPIPGHYYSVFNGGIIFFAPGGGDSSRIFAAGADGDSTHSEMYDPSLYSPADESDSKKITGLIVLGDDLIIWKENKTGALVSRDIASAVVWRDRKVGAPKAGCMVVTGENEAVVFCHDGQFRIFNGLNYDHKVSVGDSQNLVGEAVRTITESLLDPLVTYYFNFVWHRGVLHFFYLLSGVRKALVLFPRSGYGWMPWDAVPNEFFALAENESRWVFLHSDGYCYEQSPLGGTTKDRGTVDISWYRREAPIWPQNRRNTLNVERCFIEGIFGGLIRANFIVNESEIVTASIAGAPESGTLENTYSRWFQLFPPEDTQLSGRSIELELNGVGPSTQRAIAFDVTEEDSLGIPSTPTVRQDEFSTLSSKFSRVVVYHQFDNIASPQKDVSGYGLSVTWQSASALALLSTMKPYGGVSGDALATAGFLSSNWGGMDYIGDDNGACSKPQVFEYVFATSTEVFLERCYNGGNIFRVYVYPDWSISIDIYTSGTKARRFNWVSAAGAYNAAASSTTPFILQVLLYDTGNKLKVWGSLKSQVLTEIAMTRTAIGSAGGYTGFWSIGYLAVNLRISHLRRIARFREESEARNFHNWVKGLT